MSRPAKTVSRIAPLLLAAAAAWLAAACAGQRAPRPGAPPEVGAEARPEPETPARWYWAYVANRASDVVSRIRFGPEGAAYEKPVQVGVMPDANDAPDGLAVSADGERWFVTTAPSDPAGRLFAYETGTDRLLGSVPVGHRPGAVALAPDGATAWVSGPGDDGGRAAALSVVRTVRGDSLRPLGRVAAPCSDPRGSALGQSGDRVYVACAGDGRLLEVDAGGRRVRRALELTAGTDAGPGPCGPSAVAAGEGRVWVACAGSGGVLEVDVDDFRLRRHLPAGTAPAALALSPDGGLLLAADRAGGTLSVIRLDDGRELARLETSRAAPSGVAVSDDGRYAFVANAAGGRRRSTVDVFDLRALARVATVEVEHGAAAVAFWRSVSTER